jgi:hypothetical protein
MEAGDAGLETSLRRRRLPALGQNWLLIFTLVLPTLVIMVF